jgi:hypothetical protein
MPSVRAGLTDPRRSSSSFWVATVTAVAAFLVRPREWAVSGLGHATWPPSHGPRPVDFRSGGGEAIGPWRRASASASSVDSEPIGDLFGREPTLVD